MKYLCAVLISCLMSTASLWAGVVFEVETKDHSSSSKEIRETEISAEGKNLKMSIPAKNKKGADGEMIFRADRREMVVVDHDGKSYSVIDQEMLESVAGQVNQAMSRLEETLKNVPEEQRAMVEKMMKKQLPQVQETKQPTTKLVKTKMRKKQNGYPCVKYEVHGDKGKTMEMWVTEWGNIEGGKDAAEAFKGMAAFFENMLSSFSSMSGASRFGGNMKANPMTHLNEIDGFPVIVHSFDDDGKLENESQLRSSERRKLDPADFEPPAGYKRQEMFRR